LDRSENKGTYFKDILTFHNTTDTDNADEDKFPYVMGCSAEETGVIYNQEANGLLGLKRVKSAGFNNVPMMESFSLCFGDGKSVGGMVFGDWWTNPILLSNYEIAWLDEPETPTGWKRQKIYCATIKEFNIGNTTIKETQKQLFSNNRWRGSMFDSGSSDLWVHPDLYSPILTAIKEEAAKKLIEEHRVYILKETDCTYMSYENAMAIFPTLKFTFENGAVIELAPNNYIQYKRGKACIAIFRGYENESVAFGSTQMQNNLVIHDLKNKRLGWVNLESCADFNKRLQKALATNTPISISQKKQTTTTLKTASPLLNISSITTGGLPASKF